MKELKSTVKGIEDSMGALSLAIAALGSAMGEIRRVNSGVAQTKGHATAIQINETHGMALGESAPGSPFEGVLIHG